MQEWQSEALALYDYAIGMRGLVAALRSGCVQATAAYPLLIQPATSRPLPRTTTHKRPVFPIKLWN